MGDNPKPAALWFLTALSYISLYVSCSLASPSRVSSN